MRSGPDSVWNKRVIEILLEKLIQKGDEDQWRLPKVSERYFVDMLRDKVKRVRSYWAATQPRITATGDREAPVDVEERLNERYKLSRSYARVNQRRRNVSI
jgi:hypothetical protein